MSNYSKHKERLPQDTVLEIQRILDKMGLATTLSWTPELYDGVRSNRLTIHQTTFGSNGKGTDRDYATASAYAELIERIQNDMLAYRPSGPSCKETSRSLPSQMSASCPSTSWSHSTTRSLPPWQGSSTSS